MLYPKNQSEKLSAELFRNPTSEYRGTPFWAWNCKLDKDELLWQLEVFKKMGLGGAHMHVRTGMATPYLSDEHMALIKACVEKCKEEQMLAWLYDEDRWPSGCAGGIVTREEQYRMRYLLMTTRPYTDQGNTAKAGNYSSAAAGRSENGELLACFDVVLDENSCLKSYNRIAPDAQAQGTKWYAYLEVSDTNPWYNNQTYVDTLNPAAIRRFIEVTYERYRETLGEDLGGAAPAIFTDEPQFSHKQTLHFPEDKNDVVLPWTTNLAETFFEAYGEDLIAGIPELFWELPDGKVSTVRYHYHDHTCQRFTEAFADQCGAWCADHGLMLTGHMMEEPTLRSQTCALGETMRSYRGFQLPGIDMLCDSVELTTAKQAQSAAHQFGREGVLSELYGVTGWDFDFRGHKFQGDWQAALGITVRVPHLSWVSMEGEAKRDYPASIHYQSPWWKDYSFVEDHFARLNTAMTRGKALVKVGVVHPVESYWLHFGPASQTADIRTQLEENFHNVTDWLIKGSIDFDFISESLLPEQCARGGAPLRVGEMAYDAIVVPGCLTLRGTTLERLEAFRAAGGKLVFMGQAPVYEDAKESSRGAELWQRSLRTEFTRDGILSVLDAQRELDIRDITGCRTENLVTQMRCDGDSRWLMIAHGNKIYHKHVPRAQELVIRMKGQWDVEEYDTLTGKVRTLPSEVRGGWTVLRRVKEDGEDNRFFDLDSLLLHLVPRGTAPAVQKADSKRWKQLPVPNLVEYSLDEPNVYLLDKASGSLDGENWTEEMEILRLDNVLREQLGWKERGGGVAQPWAVADEEPIRVKIRFRVLSTCEVKNVKLAMEQARDSAVKLNGAAAQMVVDGWFTDKSIMTVSLGDLHPGENIVEAEVPLAERIGLEWCYLLGDFGVCVVGSFRQIMPKAEKLGFADVVHQGFAHYGGNITYRVEVETEGGDVKIWVPHYTGSAVRAILDGKKGYIAYSPNTLELKDVAPGKHTLELTLLGHRFNCFGPVHLADPIYPWQGPESWRTRDVLWTESYRLKELGIMTAPVIECEVKK